jgi:glycosyltransferase involved in cell wall biosynthesis
MSDERGAARTPPDESLSICIPACNEARGIRVMLESVFAQAYGGDLEVIVLANGCTDGTEDVVREFAQRRPVRLLVTEVRGKPNAWNRLLDEARNNLVVFADADVTLAENALDALVSRIGAADRPVAVGALSRPETKDCDYLTRILNPPSPDHGGIVGRLYIVDRVALRAELGEHGYDGMPRDVIHEDGWISVLLGPTRWTIEPSAIVDFCPARWFELLRVERRYVRAERQFREEYAHLLAGRADEALWLNETREQRWARRRERWRTARTAGERLGIVLNYFAKRIIRGLAERQVSREKKLPLDQAFERSGSMECRAPEKNPGAARAERSDGC